MSFLSILNFASSRKTEKPGPDAAPQRGLIELAGIRKDYDSFAPLEAPVARIHRDLKREFDPHSLFNPGRLYADL